MKEKWIHHKNLSCIRAKYKIVLRAPIYCWNITKIEDNAIVASGSCENEKQAKIAALDACSKLENADQA